MPEDLHILPKFRDGLSYLYLEYGHLEKSQSSVCFTNERDVVAVPASSLAVIFLGPGTSVTHAAMSALADNGCSVVWTGADATRFYAQGLGETRKSARQLKQALLWANPNCRLKVVRHMYSIRFPEGLPDDLTIEQIRGKEGVRVREAYANASRETGVKWEGRNYTRGEWDQADPINRALSTANACLNGLCHAAIVSTGYSPAIGFVHTGKMLSFVYDIADLYKAEVTVPLSFQVVSEGANRIEGRVRERCRNAFYHANLLSRIIPDIDRILDIPKKEIVGDFDVDQAMPGWLWNESGPVSGGVNYGGDDRGERSN